MRSLLICSAVPGLDCFAEVCSGLSIGNGVMDQSTRNPSGLVMGDAVPAAHGADLGRLCLQDGLLAEQIPCFQKGSYTYLKAATT